ncbi:SDR family NAD(P)-dependent oxidoreductase [Streptacidiphilus cavernicola]|uniref:SDR family NAD(P)-dependent oxidoreductase n=1 Tax=Streptacidiphilus cavernicola TaxID=3342716 RepID=A0ABV6VSI0_9ACTN
MSFDLSSFDRAYWQDRNVLVTGGASFIGSHLTDLLVELGARVSVADDLSSGRRENLADQLERDAITFHEVDLRDAESVRTVLTGVDTVFHLAAAHGGRGYVDLHQSACAENLYLDGLVFRTAAGLGVDKVVFASSGCIYPLHIQGDLDSELKLTEDLAGPPYNPDGMYGNAKLMGELTLRAMHQDTGLKAASCRYFTVYGPRGIENHAVMAMMGRALVRQSPFEIWGDGRQIRNWTHVYDIVRGTVLAGERISDGSAVNLGTTERVTVLDAAQTICELADHTAEFAFRTDMPVGPVNRVADNTLAAELLGWTPQVPFAEGVRSTFAWYRAHRDPAVLGEVLESLLTSRGEHVPVLTGV